MNRLYIAILYCILPSLSSAQYYSYSCYSWEDGFRSESRDYTFEISNGYYELNSIYNWNGSGCAQIYTESISYGFALRIADTILLHDAMAGYNMKVLVTDTTLKVLDGFEGMKDIVFTGYGSSVNNDFMVRFYMKKPNEYLSRRTGLDSMLFSGDVENDELSYRFSGGLYVSGLPEYYKSWPKLNPDSVGSHMIFTKNKYEYKDGSVLLTKGEWRRRGDYILLNDHTLKAYFILKLTGNNKFVTEVFPFANYSLELMKVE